MENSIRGKERDSLDIPTQHKGSVLFDSRNRKVPNFFILGAPKAGTSAIAKYLHLHPQVFTPTFKEPMFFNTDHRFAMTPLSDQYLELFKQASSEVRAIGEGSTAYLVSKGAVANIEATLPGAKYIVCLRNPIEQSESLHSQFVYSQFENILDFETAWAAQPKRRQGKKIPTLCPSPDFLDYAYMSSLGAQTARLLAQVERERVFFVFMDELQTNPKKLWGQLQDFLGLDDDGRVDFFRVNDRKSLKSPFISKTMHTALIAKRRLNIPFSGKGLYHRIHLWNKTTGIKPVLAKEFRRELQIAFQDDIKLLGQLLGRDLTHWS